tara:strand:+ start:667 stop:879 length:213 start_codon:yes stop_codon:yes gene_type:complete
MRKTGDITNKICWKLIIELNDEVVLDKEFKTLKDVSNELGLSYNIVSEMVLGRKKNKSGRYEPKYTFSRL